MYRIMSLEKLWLSYAVLWLLQTANLLDVTSEKPVFTLPLPVGYGV
jgi:ABC-type transport system involved in cytochrome c biogenesis ATPase subunit